MRKRGAQILFVVFCTILGFILVSLDRSVDTYSLGGLLIGLFTGLVILTIERYFRRASSRTLVSGFLGLVLGLLLARILGIALADLLVTLPDPVVGALQTVITVALGYLGVVVVMEKGQEVRLLNLVRVLKEQPRLKSYKILDTSVIIDGRIADICETGFLEGTLVIPQFILRELQHIADSSDPLKRNRGRRGLDILQRIQKKVDVHVEISDMDFPEIREVDAKLVALAKAMNAKVLTNDFNLNKVAELHGVAVLNINELTNALKPVVLPGEEMRVYVLKEGKEYNQGVAYLDDGTMVVIDNGRRYIGQTIDVCVTSVLQTTAGRMIFSRLKEEAEAA